MTRVDGEHRCTFAHRTGCAPSNIETESGSICRPVLGQRRDDRCRGPAAGRSTRVPREKNEWTDPRIRETSALRNFGHARRWWTQRALPLRSVTGAMPECDWSSVAERQRERSLPSATDSHGAHTSPAPGKLSKEIVIRVVGKHVRDAGVEFLRRSARLRGIRTCRSAR